MMRRFLLLTLVALGWACNDTVSVSDQVDPLPLLPSLSILDAPPSACYAPEEVTLLADQTIPVGSIRVGNDQDNLYVIYETSSDWPMWQTSLFVGDDVEGVPTNKNGNPKVGQFPFTSDHSPATTQVVWKVPADQVPSGSAIIAAYAQVGPEDAREGAWAEGPPITQGRSWAMYFTYDLQECAVTEVGSQGGTVATLGQDVVLNIPSGALDGPTEITIEPIDPASIGVSGEESLVHGVLPIEGTIYRFGPDGLHFDEPVEVRLQYDPDALPLDTDEAFLGVYILNGVFQPLTTEVDKENHVLIAATTHFSDYFAGLPSLSDLFITSLSTSIDPLRNDEDFTLSVEAATSPVLAPVPNAELTLTLSGGYPVRQSIPSACAYDDVASSGDTSIYRCQTGYLSPGAVAGPFDFVMRPIFSVNHTLTITTRIDPDPDVGVSDVDASNDLLEIERDVVASQAADLRISGIGFSPAVKKAGTEMTVHAIVESRDASPDAVDAGLQIEFLAGQAGIDIPGELLPDGCTVSPGLTRSTVACDLGTLAPGQSTTRDIVTIPLQAGTRSVEFSVSPTEGDLNPADNTGGGEYTAETSQLDLAVAIDESFDPILPNQTVAYSATVQSLAGSIDPLPRGTLRIQAQGDIHVTNVSDACVDVSAAVAGVDAAVNCDLPSLAPGETAPDFMGMVVEALSPDQEIQAEALLLLPDYVDDPDESNNSDTETTRVRADVEADLGLTAFSVDSDPAKANLDLTYSMQVSNATTSVNDVSGATLELVIDGAVETESLPTFCTSSSTTVPARTTVSCSLPDLARGTSQAAFATVRPTSNALGTDLVATATVRMPPDGVDPDESDNAGELTTPVVSPEMDLILAPIGESADPIDETETVVYSLQAANSAGSDSPDAAPEGSRIELRLTDGNATLVSASPDCEDFSSAGPEPVIVACSFGPLPPGAVTPVYDVELAPVGAPQILEVSVEVQPHYASTEVNPGDNSATETTTVNLVQTPSYVYVVNQSSNNVSVVDPGTDQVVATIPVGLNPYAAAITPDGSEVWVTHSAGSVDIISTASNTAAVGAVSVGSALWDLAFSPDGATAYFSRNSSGAITVVDVASRSVSKTITGLSFPRGIAVLPDGSKAYVAGNAAVFVLELTGNTLSNSIAVDGQAYFVAAAPDNSAVYVTQDPSTGPGLLRTIDTGSDALVGPGIAVGSSPYPVELNPTGTEAYVADGSGTLYFVDLVAGSTTTSIPVTTGTGSRLSRNADGSSLFLTSYSDPGILTEIDTGSRSVSATTSVGSYPVGIAVKN